MDARKIKVNEIYFIDNMNRQEEYSKLSAFERPTMYKNQKFRVIDEAPSQYAGWFRGTRNVQDTKSQSEIFAVHADELRPCKLSEGEEIIVTNIDKTLYTAALSADWFLSRSMLKKNSKLIITEALEYSIQDLKNWYFAKENPKDRQGYVVHITEVEYVYQEAFGVNMDALLEWMSGKDI